jgi:Zn-finger protein
MEEHCPGSPSWILRGDKVIKDCTNCTFPHIPENYEKMLDFLRFRNSKREISDDLRKKLESRAQDEGEKK